MGHDVPEYLLNRYRVLPRTRVDSTVEGIHEAAKRINADLIAMETHGRTGLSRFFYGSQTESVVNHADIPVLTVRIQEYKQHYSPFSDLV